MSLIRRRAAAQALVTALLAGTGWILAIAGAAAQHSGAPDIIPPSVRPGAIEAEYEVEIAPGVSMAPTVISPYEPEQAADAVSIEFVLSAVELDGADALSASALSALYADKVGRTIKLAEIFEIARAITRHYAEAGYPLSLAYVPAQEIDRGAVRIRIIEGFIGEIEIAGAPKRAERRLRALGEKIMADRPLRQRTLERYLLLANEIPGLAVTGVLSRGTSPERGVKMTLAVEEKRLSAAANVNNRASRAVGREQIVGRSAFSGLLTGVDQISLSTVQSLNMDELAVYGGRYSTILTPEGLALNIAATRSDAAPGVPFLRVLGFETEGWTAGAGLSYPLVLTRDVKAGVSAMVNWKEFRSAFGVTPNTLDRLWTTDIDVSVSIKDRWDGVNAIGVSLSKGWDIFNATEAGSPLASRAGAGAEFFTVGAELSRIQRLADWSDMTVAVKAQTANRPLLSSEQCGFGGAGFGRGYDPFEIAGDRCIVAMIELRASPAFLERGRLKAVPFVSFDAGAAQQKGPLSVGENRNATLYSFAAGTRLALTKYLSASAELGVPLKGVVAQEGDDDPRFFFALEAKY
ncbi:MAG: ShlB/FhaC/HecB family hemolysin secretion/activation protein [Parvularculaceae bacterium]|nr:ShlB/FhaC/HecB family hemolysin secretion/activation protein [Parvularculaceae bacterium]